MKISRVSYVVALSFLQTVLLISFAATSLANDATAPKSGDETRKPNILYIMSDDHTSTGVGCYGSRLAYLNPTPNIDRIAKEGVRLANCFCTNSICTPSRATIMSGQYSHTNGVYTLIQELPHRKHNLPRMIKAADAVTDISLKWLKNRKQKNKPFFLMHHFKAPHDDFENAERYDFLYQDEKIPEPDSLRNRANHGPDGQETYGTSVGKRNKRRRMGMHMFVDDNLDDDQYITEAYQRYLKKFLRCVKGVDDNVGRLLAHLEKTGELDNTVIVYTADQGFMLGEHDYIDKRWMYEESLRMPFVIRYPKKFKAGTVNEDIINNVDFCPTLLELAGATDQIASLAPDQKLEGRSFVSNLQGNTPDDWRTASYYRYWMHMAHHDNPAHFGVRTKDFKLIFFYGRKLDDSWFYNPQKVDTTEPYWELYDLRNDPKEMNNVINDPQYVETFKTLKNEIYQLKVETGDTDQQFPEVKELFESKKIAIGNLACRWLFASPKELHHGEGEILFPSTHYQLLIRIPA